MQPHAFQHKGMTLALRFTKPEPFLWRVAVFHDGVDTGLASTSASGPIDDRGTEYSEAKIRRYLILAGETIVGIIPGIDDAIH